MTRTVTGGGVWVPGGLPRLQSGWDGRPPSGGFDSRPPPPPLPWPDERDGAGGGV